MEKYLKLSLNEENKIAETAKALSTPLRVKILKLLSKSSLNLKELSIALDLPLTTIASNIDILEKAGLIRCIYQAGKHGYMKLSSIVYENLHIDFMNEIYQKEQNEKVFNIPIGSYYSIDVSPTCGLVDENGYIGKDDNVSSFYDVNRTNAQLLWFFKGFIEYRIPIENIEQIKDIEIQAEICSEAPGYRNVWPSDITLLLNDVDVGTFTSPGDFGGRRGKLTPLWWSLTSTQFGILKTWNINDVGTFLDHKMLTHVKVNDIFKNKNQNYLSIKIGVKSDAKNVGGLNIFGQKFGDYPYDLIVKVNY